MVNFEDNLRSVGFSSFICYLQSPQILETTYQKIVDIEINQIINLIEFIADRIWIYEKHRTINCFFEFLSIEI